MKPLTVDIVKLSTLKRGFNGTSNTRSDTVTDTTTSNKTTVREFLRTHGEVTSKEQLRASTDVPGWYTDQIPFPRLLLYLAQPQRRERRERARRWPLINSRRLLAT